MLRSPAIASLVLLLLAACGGDPAETPADHDMGAMEGDAAMDHDDPHGAFLAHLTQMCGRAFRGEATLATSDAFADDMVMHIRECDEDEVRIPLHVGENRSRTWIVTRTDAGLRLKHDHRHPDGTDEDDTMYGGDTTDEGTPYRQSFPADAYTSDLIPEAATNVWTITIEPGERLVYHLTRHDQPRATFEFDLTDEVEPPPAPWGYEGS